jgi:hypothetical protein
VRCDADHQDARLDEETAWRGVRSGFDLQVTPPTPYSACCPVNGKTVSGLTAAPGRGRRLIPGPTNGWNGEGHQPTNVWLDGIRQASTCPTAWPIGIPQRADRVAENRRLNRLAESGHGNVGGCHWDAKACSPPMPGDSVGAVIVVRGRESRPHGEGRQSVGSFRQQR